jgi:hypothetical protein
MMTNVRLGAKDACRPTRIGDGAVARQSDTIGGEFVRRLVQAFAPDHARRLADAGIQ